MRTYRALTKCWRRNKEALIRGPGSRSFVRPSLFLSWPIDRMGRLIYMYIRYTIGIRTARRACSVSGGLAGSIDLLLGLNRRCLSFSAAEHDNKPSLEARVDRTRRPWRQLQNL